VHAAVDLGTAELGRLVRPRRPRSDNLDGDAGRGFARPGGVLRGRRAGNIILPAGNVPMIRLGKHERVITGAELAEFIGGARPRLDEPA